MTRAGQFVACKVIAFGISRFQAETARKNVYVQSAGVEIPLAGNKFFAWYEYLVSQFLTSPCGVLCSFFRVIILWRFIGARMHNCKSCHRTPFQKRKDLSAGVGVCVCLSVCLSVCLRTRTNTSTYRRTLSTCECFYPDECQVGFQDSLVLANLMKARIAVVSSVSCESSDFASESHLAQLSCSSLEKILVQAVLPPGSELRL